TVGFSVSNVAAGAKRMQVGYNADATIADLDLQRVGEAFKMPALQADRYKTRINAHITANGSGTDSKAMNVTAAGTASDSTLFGGRIPNLAFDASVAQDTARVKANGAFAEFDPAVASGKQAFNGKVGGTVDVDATVNTISTGVTPDSVEGTARLTLEPSTI